MLDTILIKHSSTGKAEFGIFRTDHFYTCILEFFTESGNSWRYKICSLSNLNMYCNNQEKATYAFLVNVGDGYYKIGCKPSEDQNDNISRVKIVYESENIGLCAYYQLSFEIANDTPIIESIYDPSIFS